MSSDEVMFIASNTVALIFYLSMPVIVAATVVGVIVALFQTLIQLQEQTLAFTAKLATVIFTLFYLASWMSDQLLAFLSQMLHRISGL